MQKIAQLEEWQANWFLYIFVSFFLRINGGHNHDYIYVNNVHATGINPKPDCLMFTTRDSRDLQKLEAVMYPYT